MFGGNALLTISISALGQRNSYGRGEFITNKIHDHMEWLSGADDCLNRECISLLPATTVHNKSNIKHTSGSKLISSK